MGCMEGETLFQPATSFTQLRYVIIWCKIQVIIDPLLQGFVEEFGECVDVNECAEDNPCGEAGECVNQIGSYECMCQPGFR